MKYIDAERLKAEIERRIEEYNIQSLRGAELSDLLSFITSLQQEHPEVDLEKALDEYYKNADFGPSEAIEYDVHKDIARHFYELGQQNCSKISNNSLKELRKEVIKFNQEHFDELHSDMDTIDIVHIVASHFAEWGAIHYNARKED